MWDGKRLSRQTQRRKRTEPNIHNKESKHYPSTSQPRSRPGASHVELPSVLTPQHQVRYLALHNADSAGITLKVAELHWDFLVKKSAERTDTARMKTSFIRAVKLLHNACSHLQKKKSIKARAGTLSHNQHNMQDSGLNKWIKRMKIIINPRWSCTSKL